MSETASTASGDLTQGPIMRTLLTFSIPMLVTSVLQSVNMTVNAAWVGRLIGESALAGTANANMMLFLVFSMIFGLGTATTIRVGQFHGAGDREGARAVYAGGIGFCTALAVIAAAIGTPLAGTLLRIMATPPESLDLALSYLTVSLITLPLGVVSMTVSMGLRGAGDSRSPLYGMILSVVLGAALNPLLILGMGPFPRLGIAGSALASALATIAGTAVTVALVQLRAHPLRMAAAEWRHLLPERATRDYILAKGVPMGAQMVAMTGAGVIMIGLVNRQGLNASAAYGTVLQLWNYVQMPSLAIGAAVSAMVAQALGAGLESRVNAIARVGNGVVLAMTAVLAVALIAFGRPLLAAFLGAGSPAIPIGRHILAISTWSFVAGSYVMIANSTMRAYGAVIPQLIVMIVTMYPVRIGFYFVARPWLGEEAVWWAYPVGTALGILLTWRVFTRGRWRSRR